MQIEWLPIDQIVPFEENPKVSNSTTYELLLNSIQQFGLVLPLHVIPHDGRYILIDGHQRFHIVESLGWEFIPTVIHENIAYDEIPQFIETISNTSAKWDKVKLGPLLERLQNRLPDIRVTGFSQEEANKLIETSTITAAKVDLKPKPTPRKRRLSVMLTSKEYDLVSTVLAEIMAEGYTEPEAFTRMMKVAADECSR